MHANWNPKIKIKNLQRIGLLFHIKTSMIPCARDFSCAVSGFCLFSGLRERSSVSAASGRHWRFLPHARKNNWFRAYQNDNSYGHTTDFHPGKTDLPKANSSKISRAKSSRVLLYLGGKFSEGHTPDIGSQGFHASWIFWSVNSRRQDAQGSQLIKETFISFISLLFLTPIQRARWRRRRRLVPLKFLSQREVCPVLSSKPPTERLLASNLGISFFPSFGLCPLSWLVREGIRVITQK